MSPSLDDKSDKDEDSIAVSGITPEADEESQRKFSRKDLIEEKSSNFPTEDIAPLSVRILRLPYERAHMLATLPRSKTGELFTASLVGFVASLPGGWDGFHQAFLKNPREPLEPFSLVEMIVCVVLLALVFFSRLSRNSDQTSLEYLASLHEEKPVVQMRWKEWFYARPRIIGRVTVPHRRKR